MLSGLLALASLWMGVGDVDQSPIDLAITPGGQRALVACRGSRTLRLVDLDSGAIASQLEINTPPSALSLSTDGARWLLVCHHSCEIVWGTRDQDRLTQKGRIKLADAPRDAVFDPSGKTIFVSLEAQGTVSRIDLEHPEKPTSIEVGKLPRRVALSPDGRKLAVSIDGDSGIAVVDANTMTREFAETFQGINFGGMQIDRDGQFVYVPWMVYRRNPINASNIRLGWVLASRVARVRLDTKARRQAISLDPPGEAVADPEDLAISPDHQWLVVAAGGTHELLLLALNGLPWQDHGGPGDHIDKKLLKDKNRFRRVPVGGRPVAVAFRNSKSVVAADYFNDRLVEVSIPDGTITRTIPLGPSREPSLARKGEMIFHDARRSLDQWYSCHSCHRDGLGNTVAMDTLNDGSIFTFKMVPSLVGVASTIPWTWHGWQRDLSAAMRKSLTETMLGPAPSEEDVRAVIAYVQSIEPTPTLPREESAERGRRLFDDKSVGCAGCHQPPLFTSDDVHDVGTGSKEDRHKGYSAPSLLGVRFRSRFLHDGRSESLDALLQGPHSPERVAGTRPLSPDERRDLIAYLKTL